LLAGGLLARAWRAADDGVTAGQPLLGQDVLPFVGTTVEMEMLTPDVRTQLLQELRAAGFGWVRQRLDWGQIEPEPGVYDWSRADLLVTAIDDAGLMPVLVLDGSPAWARAPQDRAQADNPMAPPAEPESFARFAAAVARRYGDRVRHYQLWDEPNIAPHWGNRHVEPVAYAQLLRAASPAVRAADADAVIWTAALAPTGDRGHTAIDEIYFLQRMLAAGAGPFFDVVAVQPFGFGHAPEDSTRNVRVLNFQRAALVRQALRAAGFGGKPLVAARYGWNRDLYSPWGTVTPAAQAAYAAEALELAWTRWPWLAGMGWAAALPNKPGGDPAWGFGLVDASGQAAPVLGSIRAWQNSHSGLSRRIRQIGPIRPICLPPDVGGQALLLVALAALLAWRGSAAARLVPWAGYLGRYRQSPAWVQGAAWATLVLVYYLATWPPLILLCWVAGILLCLAEPRAGLWLAAALLPFYFQHKDVAWVDATLAAAPAHAAALWLVPALAVRLWCRQVRFARWDWLPPLLVGIGLLGGLSVWRWPGREVATAELVLMPLLLWLAVRAFVTTAEERRGVALALFAGGFLAAGWGLFTWLQGQGGEVDGVRRLVGPHFSPNHTALYLVRTVFVGAGLILAVRRRRRVWLVAATAVVFLALLLTGSRGALLLGLPAGAVIFGWLALRRRRALRASVQAQRWLLMLLTGAIVMLFLVLAWAMPERLLNLRSVFLRVDLWEATLGLWRDHWLVGVGPGGFFWTYPAYLPLGPLVEANQVHPHNVFLEVGVTWGIVGLVWLAGVAVALVMRGRVELRRPGVSFWVFAGLAAALGAGFAHAQTDTFMLLADLAGWNATAWALATIAEDADSR
jgi:O-antigen ligase